jgi:hypothetical protein
MPVAGQVSGAVGALRQRHFIGARLLVTSSTHLRSPAWRPRAGSARAASACRARRAGRPAPAPGLSPPSRRAACACAATAKRVSVHRTLLQQHTSAQPKACGPEVAEFRTLYASGVHALASALVDVSWRSTKYSGTGPGKDGLTSACSNVARTQARCSSNTVTKAGCTLEAWVRHKQPCDVQTLARYVRTQALLLMHQCASKDAPQKGRELQMCGPVILLGPLLRRHTARSSSCSRKIGG